MRLTVLGACGAFPAAGSACSGFLVEADGFRLLMDVGYATMPRLLSYLPASSVDAVVISHGHPDHCADLNPLLRARALRDDPAPSLPVYAPPRALDAVLALDRPGMLASAISLSTFAPGEGFELGPFAVATFDLPHFTPNAGIRLTADGRSLAYTGDTGPSPSVVALAQDADVFLAEATHPDVVPDDSAQLAVERAAGGFVRVGGRRRAAAAHAPVAGGPAGAVPRRGLGVVPRPVVDRGERPRAGLLEVLYTFSRS